MKKIFFILILSLILCFGRDFDKNQAELMSFKTNYAIDESKFDPLYGYNKAMTYFNDYAYKYVLIPIAKGYDYAMPDPLQGAISNFFHNILYPIRLVNNLLQAKFQNAFDETKRFLINSTIGFAGLSDAASMHFNIQRHDEDLGQTLGYWGVGEGFSLVLPILGQSNLRDIFGLVGDHFLNPITYVNSDNDYTSIAIKSYDYINTMSLNPDVYEIFTKDEKNLYEFLRDFNSLKRNKMIKE